MPVDISTLDIATPLPTSASNPLALELNGNLALAQCPSVISRLADGSIQLCAPTRGAASKSTHRTRCEWKESRYWALSSAADHWNRQQMTLTKVNSAQKVVVAQIHVRWADYHRRQLQWPASQLSPARPGLDLEWPGIRLSWRDLQPGRFHPQHSGGGWLGLHHQPAVAQPRLAPGWGGGALR